MSFTDSSDREIFIEVEWFDEVEESDDDESDAFLPQVRMNPDSNFKRAARWCFLKEAAPYNIMIAKHDPFVSEERCDLFDVIDRNVSDFS